MEAYYKKILVLEGKYGPLTKKLHFPRNFDLSDRFIGALIAEYKRHAAKGADRRAFAAKLARALSFIIR